MGRDEKILFLDFDGVLNSTASMHLNSIWRPDWMRYEDTLNIYGIDPTDLCPIALSNLRIITEAVPNMRIVVSSYWRIGRTIQELQRLLSICLPDSSIVIAKTPFRRFSEKRGSEILEYLKLKPVENYVVLDDNGDMQGIDPSRFVQTNPDNGLTYSDARRVIDIFNRGADGVS